MDATHIDAAVEEAVRAGCEVVPIYESVLVGGVLGTDMDVDYVEVGTAVVGPRGGHEVALALAGFKRVGDAWELRGAK